MEELLNIRFAAFFLKPILLVLSVVYILYGFVILKQTKIMTTVINEERVNAIILLISTLQVIIGVLLIGFILLIL